LKAETKPRTYCVWGDTCEPIFTSELLEADRNPEADPEIERLYRALNTCLDEAPVSDWEKVVVIYSMLIKTLAEIDDEKERERYARNCRDLLRWGELEAAVKAFKEIR